MVYPCDKEVLQELLRLISAGECQGALKAWASYRHSVDDKCNQCLYKQVMQSDACCLCLESKLLTLSLYEHGDGFDDALLEAARKLDDYGQQMHAQAH